MSLTKPQRAFLESADICTPPHPNAIRHEFSGITARGSSRRCAMLLERLGLIDYVGRGPRSDEDHDKEWPIYAITDAGRRVLVEEVLAEKVLRRCRRSPLPAQTVDGAFFSTKACTRSAHRWLTKGSKGKVER